MFFQMAWFNQQLGFCWVVRKVGDPGTKRMFCVLKPVVNNGICTTSYIAQLVTYAGFLVYQKKMVLKLICMPYDDCQMTLNLKSLLMEGIH